VGERESGRKGEWEKGRMGDEPMNKEDLPADLRDILKHSSWEMNTIGYSATETYLIKGINKGKNSYLKIISPASGSSLFPEKRILEWLQGKLPVPQIYYFREVEGKEYLLISEIKGLNAADDFFISDPAKMVPLVAKGLRLIHSVDIMNCPFDQRLDVKIKEAKSRVENGLVDEDDFEPTFRGKTARELFQKAVERQPDSEDLIFTHGDYCLPNVIIYGDEVSGFIDLGRAGIADMYQDLALMARSLKHNLGSERWVDLFFKEYGIENRDFAKIEYYILLDELF
jgi:aminoglycoside phosphotransferase